MAGVEEMEEGGGDVEGEEGEVVVVVGPGPMEGSMEEGDRIGFEGSGGGGTWIKRRI